MASFRRECAVLGLFARLENRRIVMGLGCALYVEGDLSALSNVFGVVDNLV